MATKRKEKAKIFFIYDHKVLKKEEDDLKNAILYFVPRNTSDDEQCQLCGHLMGMAEFLHSTISQSSPQIFRLQTQTFTVKRVGNYSLVLEGQLDAADGQIVEELNLMYKIFVTFHGSLDHIKQRKQASPSLFKEDMQQFWDTLQRFCNHSGDHLALAFQVLPTIDHSKIHASVFLQASNLLQSCQRRPGVLRGAVFHSNRVLSTQLSSSLTKRLLFVLTKVSLLNIRTHFALPGVVSLVRVFLEEEDYLQIKSKTSIQQHCMTSDFSCKVCQPSELCRHCEPQVSAVSTTLQTRECVPAIQEGSDHNSKEVVFSQSAVHIKNQSSKCIVEQHDAFTSEDKTWSTVREKHWDDKSQNSNTQPLVNDMYDCQYSGLEMPKLNLDNKLVHMKQNKSKHRKGENKNSFIESISDLDDDFVQEQGSSSMKSLKGSQLVGTRNNGGNFTTVESISDLDEETEENKQLVKSVNKNRAKSERLIGNTAKTAKKRDVLTEKVKKKISYKSDDEIIKDDIHENAGYEVENIEVVLDKIGETISDLDESPNTHMSSVIRSRQKKYKRTKHGTGSLEIELWSESKEHHAKRLTQSEGNISVDNCSAIGDIVVEYGRDSPKTVAVILKKNQSRNDESNDNQDNESLEEKLNTDKQSNVLVNCENDVKEMHDGESDEKHSGKTVSSDNLSTSFDHSSKPESFGSRTSAQKSNSKTDTHIQMNEKLEQNNEPDNTSQLPDGISMPLEENKVEVLNMMQDENGTDIDSACFQWIPSSESGEESKLNIQDEVHIVVGINDDENIHEEGHLIQEGNSTKSDDNLQNARSSSVNESVECNCRRSPVNEVTNIETTQNNENKSILQTESNIVSDESTEISPVTCEEYKNSPLCDAKHDTEDSYSEKKDECVELMKSHSNQEQMNVSKEHQLHMKELLKFQDQCENGGETNIEIVSQTIGDDNNTCQKMIDATKKHDDFSRNSKSQSADYKSNDGMQGTLELLYSRNKKPDLVESNAVNKYLGDVLSETQGKSDCETDRKNTSVSSFGATNSDEFLSEDTKEHFAFSSPTQESVNSDRCENLGQLNILSPVKLNQLEASGPAQNDVKTVGRKLSSESDAVWSPKHDGLTRLTLYVQGHSQILLLLLMEEDVSQDQKTMNALWKNALSSLGDLDVHVHESQDKHESLPYRFLKYDSFFHSLKGNVLNPTTKSEKIFCHDAVVMHDDYRNTADLSDIIVSSHTNTSYSHQSLDGEIYFQLKQPLDPKSGLPSPGDLNISIDKKAQKYLAENHNISLL